MDLSEEVKSGVMRGAWVVEEVVRWEEVDVVRLLVEDEEIG